MIKISDRLQSLTKYIFKEDIVMDVGCDHALIDIYLVQSGLLDRIVVCDVNPNALQNGIDNIEKYNLDDKIIPVLGYGIEKSNEYNINTLIISGMGSKNIIDILGSPNLDRIYKLVLQSNNNHYELRRFLNNHGFNIKEEEIIVDAKKTYINIVAIREYETDTLSELELEFGPILTLKKDYLDYFKTLRDDYLDIVAKSHSEDLRKKIKMLDLIIERLG